MISFVCPKCRKRLRVPDPYGGHEVLCPYCNSIISAPEESPRTEIEAPAAAPAAKRAQAEDDAGPALSRPTRQIDPEELIDMTAMVDIVFFLLIFFLVTSMVALHSSTPMPNPEARSEGSGSGAQSVEEIEADDDVVVVRIGRDNSVEVEGVVLPDLSHLAQRLRQLRRSGGGTGGLLVIGHGEASHGVAVSVLDAGYEAGMERARLSVTDSDSE